GDKASARQVAVANGVPVAPGYDGPDGDETLVREAKRIGFPVMVKARGGGGGRGMRVVERAEDLPEALAAARREAEAAFGDPGLLLEKLIRRAHHVEVQILGDVHANLVHLGERDCSVQRRRQKLIEETPSPVVDDALREELTAAALRLAKAVGYTNAGTVEFLVGEPGADGRRPFYFLEVNPRLQVEHPVTEAVTGLDLVELQVCIAAGEELPFEQEEILFDGHAIELRVNAEDPWHDFAPSPGRIERLDVPSTGLFGRADLGYGPGDTVPGQYDSLIGKLVFQGEDREEAIESALADAGGTTLRGPSTNLSLLAAILESDTFQEGEAAVDWLAEGLPELLAAATPPEEVVAAAAIGWARSRAQRGSPFASGPFMCWIDGPGGVRRVAVTPESGGRVTACVGRDANGDAPGAEARRLEGRLFDIPDGCEVRWESAGYRVGVTEDGEIAVVPAEGGLRTWLVRVAAPPPLPARARADADGSSIVTAPLAGTIAAVRVAEGDSVEAGDLLLTLEAMKMEHRVVANGAGAVRRLAVGAGDVVREGDLLVELG
ncbi:MAG: biotin/lipoyl-containing protein, partial [Hyphomicrobiales bacterium]